MIKSRHDTAFFQRSYSSGSSHGMTILSDFNYPCNNAPRAWWAAKLCS
ncbi:hypothetical protein [Rickettsia endosymbiont of Orchestes rusci]